MLTARSQHAGLDRLVHPHAFRHFFLSEFLRAGGNETDVVRLAGWRTHKMVDRYAQMTSFDRAREAHSWLSPANRLLDRTRTSDDDR